MNIVQSLLTNKVPRPQTKLDHIWAIVVHYPAVPKQAASTVRNYWNNEKNPVGSAHYIVDLNGTILQTIPDNEKAYHVGSSTIDPLSKKVYTDKAREIFGQYASNPETMSPNRCSIGIEMCIIDGKGHYSDETYNASVELIATLCKKYDLDPLTKVITHHDVVGWKDCPLYFVNNPDEFEIFKQKIKDKMDELA